MIPVSSSSLPSRATSGRGDPQSEITVALTVTGTRSGFSSLIVVSWAIDLPKNGWLSTVGEELED